MTNEQAAERLKQPDVPQPEQVELLMQLRGYTRKDAESIVYERWKNEVVITGDDGK